MRRAKRGSYMAQMRERARDGRREPISVRSEEIVGVTEERRRVTGDVQEWAVVNSPGAKLLDNGAGIK